MTTRTRAAPTPPPELADPVRRGRIALSLAGGLWALLLLPLTAADWGAPWVAALSRLEPWRALRGAVDDPYVVFGALTGVSFLAIGAALLPDLRRARWGGTVFAVTVLLGAIITPVSYLSTPPTAPLHVLWGAEGPLLVVIGLAGVLAAVSARRWRRWVRALLAVTLVVLVAGVLATGYYPHGPLIALSLEAAVLLAGAPRARPTAAVRPRR
ncbi:hypothetical protein [Agrococcus sp. SCSIO52902]|uniref:hypothetical protein n=1 Tax=Agrococcus sp. SCSIO52902 TaxID=2933290 RepID=UPI001FF2DAE8|nr:hypothetical protein [Agrococcus sp. SCSIO52902]UOW01389.1 hypothetical protein MU522_02960 [Agrococcus sp. SCSIO52902]